MNTSFLNGLFDQIVDRGRSLLDLSLVGLGQGDTIEDLSRALLSGRGESSGVVIAQAILAAYRSLEPEQKTEFFSFLAEAFAADEEVSVKPRRTIWRIQEPQPLKLWRG